MGTVTILNGTNAPINSCISAAVNYSWVNSLSPNEFYVHEGAAGVYSLSTRFWLGDESEFRSSGEEIGIWIGGITLGVVGLALAFVGGGAMLVATGAILSRDALAIDGISIAVKDFRNEPAVHTNIYALQNRKFIAEGTVDLKENEDGTIDWLNDPRIILRPLEESEFRSRIDSGQFVQYRGEEHVSRITDSHQTVNGLMVDGFFQHHFTITPSLGGNACWEIEGDQAADGAPIQLWERKDAKCEWTIRSGGENANVFHIYNIKLDRYASATKDGRLVTSGKAAASKFHIIKSNGMHVFLTTDGMMVFPEGGSLGNSTKLLVAPHAQGNPDWARWKLNLVEPHRH